MKVKDEDITSDEGREGSPPDRLEKVLTQRAGSKHELVQLFVTLMDGLGYTCRYVCPIRPTQNRSKDLNRKLSQLQGEKISDEDEDENQDELSKRNSKRKSRKQTSEYADDMEEEDTS